MEAAHFTSTLKQFDVFCCLWAAYSLFHDVFEWPISLFHPKRQRIYDDKLHVAARNPPFNVTASTLLVTGSNYKRWEFCDIIQCLFSRPVPGPRARKVGPYKRQGICTNQSGDHFRSPAFHWNSRTGRSLSLIWRWFVNQDLNNLPGWDPPLSIFLHNTGGTHTIDIRSILSSGRCYVFRHLLVVSMNSKSAETRPTSSSFQYYGWSSNCRGRYGFYGNSPKTFPQKHHIEVRLFVAPTN